MKKQIKLSVIVLVLIFFSISCKYYVPSRIEDNFKYCYDPNTDYSNSKLRFDGYYVILHPIKKITTLDSNYNWVDRYTDSTFTSIKFYEDAIVKRGIYNREYEYDFNTNYPLFTYYRDSGLYEINGDTIKLQLTNRTDWWTESYWYLIEEWYLILNDSTLKLLNYAYVRFEDEKWIYKKENKIEKFEFVKTDEILPSDTWLKNKDWFWCNEEDYEAWKENAEGE